MPRPRAVLPPRRPALNPRRLEVPCGLTPRPLPPRWPEARSMEMAETPCRAADMLGERRRRAQSPRPEIFGPAALDPANNASRQPGRVRRPVLAWRSGLGWQTAGNARRPAPERASGAVDAAPLVGLRDCSRIGRAVRRCMAGASFGLCPASSRGSSRIKRGGGAGWRGTARTIYLYTGHDQCPAGWQARSLRCRTSIQRR